MNRYICRMSHAAMMATLHARCFIHRVKGQLHEQSSVSSREIVRSVFYNFASKRQNSAGLGGVNDQRSGRCNEPAGQDQVPGLDHRKARG